MFFAEVDAKGRWIAAPGISKEKFAQEINDEIGRRWPGFELTESTSVTYAYDDRPHGTPRYKKHPFPLGDRFILIPQARVGARGELIFCFKSESGPRNAMHFEFMELVGKRQLAGFSNFLDDMMTKLNKKHDPGVSTRIAKAKKKKEEQYGDVYGSW